MSTFTTVVKSDPDSPPIEGYEETILGWQKHCGNTLNKDICLRYHG